ncbi:Replication protein A 70 kDa DNA-binding subunit D [Linum perenne]
MASTLLRALAPDNLSVQLHLRLLHAWKLEDPSKPGSCFGFGTHWVDDEGTTVQGESHKNFIVILQSRIEVGSVYKITGFGLRPPRKSFRTSTFPHCLNLTPTTQFHLQPPTTPPFCVDSLGYIEFEELSARVHPPSAYLTDFVGKVIGGGQPNHVHRPTFVASVQNLIVTNERGFEVKVSLWADLSRVVDATVFALEDESNPLIIAFGAFRITSFSGQIEARSCTASRISLRPTDHRSEQLRAFFIASPRAINYVPPKFDTPEKLQHHVRESYRSLQDLVDLYAAGGDSEPHYRCTALIKNFENHTKWWYQACPHCFKAVAPNHDNFWCTVHESVLAADVQYKYRLKLIVSDSTTEASFILLGMTAEKLLPISAAELVRAYPHDFGSFPPAIKFMIGQRVEFEVQLPKFSHSNPFGDFKICNISGLAIPRAEIIDNLPVPIAPRPLSPPSTHNTPMPGDPAYVAPVPTYVSPAASPSHASEGTSSAVEPAHQKLMPSSKSDKSLHLAGTQSRSPKETPVKLTCKAKETPVKLTSKAKETPGKLTSKTKEAPVKAKGTPSTKPTHKPISKKPGSSTKQMNLASPALLPISDDDQPLSHVFLTKRSPIGSKTNQVHLSGASATPPPSQISRNLSAEAFTLPTQDHSFAKKYPALHASAEYARQLKATIGQLQVPPVLEHVPSSVDISSKSKLTIPLAKVKLEKLQSSSTAIPATPQSAVGDGIQLDLGRGKRKQTRKRLFGE